MKFVNQKSTTKLFITFALITSANLTSISKFNKELLQNYRKSLSTVRSVTSKAISDIKSQYKRTIADIHKEAKKEHALVRDSAQSETKNARSLNTYQSRIVKIREIRAKTSKRHQEIESSKKAKLENAANLKNARLKQAHDNHIKQTSTIKRAFNK